MLLPRMAAASPLLTIYFVRHGETTGNRDGVLQGHQDYDLTTLGGHQATVTAARLQNVNFWQKHSSDLIRASRTAEIILAEGRHDGLELVKSPLLREFSLGVLEDLPRGTSRSEARRIKAERAGMPLKDFREPRAETANDVRNRARQFLDTLLREAREARAGTTPPGDTCTTSPSSSEREELIALIVSHGGFLYEMLSNVLGLGNEVGLPSNCSVSIIEVRDGDKGGSMEDGAGKQVSFVPRVINDFEHMVAAGLATANRVENLDIDQN